jgi:hypothetical protein
LAATATKGDGGDGAAALPKMAGDGGELRARGDGATGHERTRERGQTKENNTGILYMATDWRDQTPYERNRSGKI